MGFTKLSFPKVTREGPVAYPPARAAASPAAHKQEATRLPAWLSYNREITVVLRKETGTLQRKRAQSNTFPVHAGLQGGLPEEQPGQRQSRRKREGGRKKRKDRGEVGGGEETLSC